MKIKFHFILLIALSAWIISCKKDNYAAPATRLSGNLLYKGDTIGVENYQVPFELYQYGFGKVGPIGSSFAQDGSYSAQLFDGDYKLIVPNGQGPFRWPKTASGDPDSVSITLHGNQTLDIEVMPYYMIRDPKITGSGTTVSATFKIEKVIADSNAKDIERVNLYINKTQFVSGNGNEHNANAELSGSAITDLNDVSLTVTIPDMIPKQNYVFARIGLKIAGVEDMIFSPLQKISF